MNMIKLRKVPPVKHPLRTSLNLPFRPTWMDHARTISDGLCRLALGVVAAVAYINLFRLVIGWAS